MRGFKALALPLSAAIVLALAGRASFANTGKSSAQPIPPEAIPPPVTCTPKPGCFDDGTLPYPPYGATAVIQQTVPPPGNHDRYGYYFRPLNGAWSTNWSNQANDQIDEGWFSVNANRAVDGNLNPNLGPNPLVAVINYTPVGDTRCGGPCSPAGMWFSSVDKADAVTTAYTAFWLRASQHEWSSPLLANGIAIKCLDDAEVNPQNYFTSYSAPGNKYVDEDVFLAPDAPNNSYCATTLQWPLDLANVVTIGIDFEVNDGHSMAQTHGLLDYFARTVHRLGHNLGLRAYLYTNPWDANVPPDYATWPGERNGFANATLSEIVSNFDVVSNLVNWSTPNPKGVVGSYCYGAKLVGGSSNYCPPNGFSGTVANNKFLVTFYWDSPISLACQFYQVEGNDQFFGYNLHPHGLLPNDPHVYPLEAALLFGQGC